RLEQASGHTLAALALVDRDLPDEQPVLGLGTEVSDHEPDHLTGADRHAGGGGEVSGEQEVGVGGVQVEGPRVAGHSPHPATVAEVRGTEEEIGASGRGWNIGR